MNVVDVAPHLAAAATAIEEARWADAAAELLVAWRACRCARIARAVAAVDLRLPAPPPLDGKLVRTREAFWHELVARGDEESLRRALAAPWPTHPKEAHARVDALEPYTSARISNALLALHRTAQYTSIAGLRVSRAIFHQLIEKDDHAVVEELERCEAEPFEARRVGAAVFRRRRPALPYLSPAGEAALARIEQLLVVEERVGAPTRDNLLAAIYETPHDDAPRIVYADVLTEAGDPRGEFITLQIQRGRGGSPTKREQKLLRDGGRQWLDGLDADGGAKIVHVRGFPASAAVSSSELRAPAWATIETLHVEHDGAFRGAPHMRALRALYGLQARDLRVGQLPAYDLDLLTLDGYGDGLDADTPYAPRVLGLERQRGSLEDAVAAARRLRGLPLARRLEVIRLPAGIREVPRVLALAAETGYPFDLAGSADLARTCNWSGRVSATELRLHWSGAHPYSDVALESVYAVLSQLPAPRVEHLEVTSTEVEGLERVRTGLLRIIESWPRLRTAQILGLDASVTN